MPPPRSPSQRWGRRLLIVSLVLTAWAAAIAISGGFRVEIGGLRFSSRNPSRVALAGLAAAILAWQLAYRDAVRGAVRNLPTWFTALENRLGAAAATIDRTASAAAWLLAAAVFGLGLHSGSRVAGGADAFGYLSEAALLAQFRLGIDQSFAAALPWPNAPGSFVPLAYRLGANDVMGPTVAPGLPLLMALARGISDCGPYYTVSLCGALLVAATFRLGRRIVGAGSALAAAALVACSPVVVFESLVVMADVPAAAFWICALAVASRRTSAATLTSGVLTGMAILIRPNLLPLAAFPWLLAICRAGDSRTVALRTALFASASVPAAFVIAWINQHLYGSAFSSGYGDLGSAFSLAHVRLNAQLYSSWWLESQGVAGILFVAALWPWRAGMRRELVILVAYAITAALLYLFYLPFDQWWYLRFLIPAIPIVMLLCADAASWATAWAATARGMALTALVVFAASHTIPFMDAKDILGNADAERRRYLDAAVYLDAALPPAAVVLSMQHSGSVRYYTGRLTMRSDVLDAAALDRAVGELSARGVPAYALLESWEEEDFRRRFAGQRTLARLDEGPLARSADGELRLYTLSAERGAGPVTILPQVGRGCVDVSPAFAAPAAAGRLGR